MNIFFLGHASFLVEGQKECVLMDPWFSKNGAYNSSWFQYPYNHHLKKKILQIKKKIYTFISHQHEDHYDLDFLSSYNGNLIIPNYKIQSFHNIPANIEKKKIIFLNDNETFKTEEFSIRLFLNEDSMDNDSGILVSDGKTNFLNLNDCKIYDRIGEIKKQFGKISFYAAQFSGASWHPHNYKMSKKKESDIAKKKINYKFKGVVKSIEDANCDYFLTSAGPPVFLDERLIYLSKKKDSIFPDHLIFNKFVKKLKLKTKVLNPLPGMSISIINKNLKISSPDKYAKLFLNKTKNEYLKWYKKKINANFKKIYKDNFNNIVLLKKLGNEIKLRLEAVKDTSTFVPDLQIGIFGYNFLINVDFKKMKISEIEKSEIPKKFYTVYYLASEIKLLLEKKLSWESLSLTFRSQLSRFPDNYYPLINSFLYCDLSKLYETNDIINKNIKLKERIKIKVDDKEYEINKYCPHQGANLEQGWSERGFWICPRHQWKFNLSDDGQTPNKKFSINCKLIK